MEQVGNHVINEWLSSSERLRDLDAPSSVKMHTLPSYQPLVKVLPAFAGNPMQIFEENCVSKTASHQSPVNENKCVKHRVRFSERVVYYEIPNRRDIQNKNDKLFWTCGDYRNFNRNAKLARAFIFVRNFI